LTQIRTPLILVNFKTYSEATGKKAVKLAKTAEKSKSRNRGLHRHSSPVCRHNVHRQHRVGSSVCTTHRPNCPGSFTGHILPESIRETGAVGTLINHSERRLKLADIDAIITRARESDLLSVVCANNAAVSAAAAALKPNMIAVEPPELIGTGIPVSKAKPEVVSGTVDLVKRINPDVVILCGAGITRGEDVAAALRLGTEGVLVASGVVKAKDPYTVLLEFAESITKA